MKKYIIILAASLLALTACNKDFLDTTPEDSVAPAVIFQTTDNAKLAINGIARLMTKQYMSNQGYNGEGTIKTHYGEWPGNDLARSYTSYDYIVNFEAYDQQSYYVTIYGWFYYYKLISNANQIIANIDNAEGTESDRNFLKAQALVYRAYSYLMVSQLYAPRWAGSNGGNAEAIPLRLEPSTDPLPKSTLAEVYAQIYKDLDDAITLFGNSDYVRPAADFYLPDVTVAHAVYARAAITREDWATAATHAAAARTGHALMSNDDYLNGGFSTPNSEWIWGVYDAEDQTLYYYSYFAYIGSNASSSQCRSYPSLISKELYEQIPATDVRKAMFLEPSAAEWAECTQTSGRSTKSLYTRAKSDYASKLYGTSLVYAYMQFKFQATFYPGGGSFHLFRSAEMLYTEAEAKAKQGQESAAQALMNQAVQPYDPAYNCTATGTALMDEIKLYRRFDLWGEGNNWFDYKRWNQKIERKSWANGGSYVTALAKTIEPNDKNGWTFYAPLKETDYNPFFDK
ncbi:MAG: RagB/SusD family nutrient uptake outer membrane protein [Bacteroidales bacterium]|nr:RagB/SusD family nutrient uptake outer membrane protein [Bacteroidales bacterium]